jgi:dienelactone hydrolase
MHAAIPVQAFGLIKWLAAVPIQVHYANSDPYKDDTAVSRLRTEVEESGSAFRSSVIPSTDTSLQISTCQPTTRLQPMRRFKPA